jgi:orotate phosphoribosyltransferase-like protein
MNQLTELYMDGVSIEEIAEELGLSNSDEVTFLLRQMKVKNGTDYIHEFKEMVVERIVSGSKKGEIVKDLKVAYRTINKYLEEFNVEYDRSENKFSQIKWNKFDTCPTCMSLHINDLNTNKEESDNTKNSYCLDCGTEWFQKGKRVYKVLWEYVR